MSTELAVIDWTPEKLDLIKRTIAKGCDDDELALFTMVCKRTRLDPFARQIYARKQWDGKLKREVMVIITSIDGFRLTAQRSRVYAGQLGPQWCGMDGAWRDVWIGDGYPCAARVGVLRKDFQEPIWSVAKWDSYVQTYRDKDTGKFVVSPMWAKMGDHMLAKCAEALSLRRAFPNELSGVYAEEEADQIGAEAPAPPPMRNVAPRELPAAATVNGNGKHVSAKQAFAKEMAAWTKLNREDVPAACKEFAAAHGHEDASNLTDDQYNTLRAAAESLAADGVEWMKWTDSKPVET